MGYETAPATKMLATRCACCSKELVDAVSVEAGVGPECRKRHGFSEAQLEPDWAAVLLETDGLVAVAEIGNVRAREAAWRLGGEHTRKLANLLTHRIAVDQTGAFVTQLTRALRALGYVKMSQRIEKRLARVQIEVDGDDYVVRAPYTDAAVEAMRCIPGRRWDADKKRNRIPASSKRALFQVLSSLYPGTTAIGPKGLFTL
jgi:hypothetical protein